MRIFSFCLMFFSVYQVGLAVAQDRLGIALKQGHDYTYISHIDPFGAGAASGLMVGDHIKEVGNFSIWYKYQVEAILRQHNKQVPFLVVVQRNGTLHTLNVSYSTPTRQWERIAVEGAHAQCFFSPSVACISASLDVPRSSDTIELRYGKYYRLIKALVLLGQVEKARLYLDEKEATFYAFQKFFTTNAGTLMETMKMVGKVPDERLFNFVAQRIRVDDFKDNLRMAETFKQYGHEKAGLYFFDKAMAVARSNQKSIKFSSSQLGEVLAAFRRYDLIKSYVETSDFDLKWKNNLLKNALIYFLKEYDVEGSKAVLDMIFNSKRTWTDNSMLEFIRVFIKMQRTDFAQKLLSELEARASNNPQLEQLYAAPLMRGNAAIGRVDRARAYLDRHFSNSLDLHMDLIIEAAESKSSNGIAVQYYTSLSPLIEKTMTMYQAMPAQEKARLPSAMVTQFLTIAAANLSSHPVYGDFKAYSGDTYDVKRVIDSFIAVHRYQDALIWTDKAEKDLGQVYQYEKLFNSLGSSGSAQVTDSFSKHPKFEQYRQNFLRHHAYRLFWNGRVQEAAQIFQLLSADEQRQMLSRQVYFVRSCVECTL